MTTPNQAQVDAWDGDSGLRWVADADRRDVVLAPVADALFAAAALQPGERVLDVGCGCGVTTLTAARLTGHATGIDLSSPMLEVAVRRAEGTHAVFLKADAQTHDFTEGPFDVVITRFGTMFFDDPVAAFANIGAAMRPAGRMCLATWQALGANDWLAVPGAALLRYGSLPDMASNEPGMFAQSEPDVIIPILDAAGWTGVRVEPVSLTLRLGTDVAEATDYLADTGVARRVLETIDEAARPTALAEVAETLAAHRQADGVHLGAAINIITARR